MGKYDSYKRGELKQALYSRYRGCQACKESDLIKLVVHHVSYKNFDNEKMKDVRLLCFVCHNLFHRFVKGSDPDLKQKTDVFIIGGKFWK